MKKKKDKFESYSNEELAESFIFPITQTEADKERDSLAIKKLKESMSIIKPLTEEEILNEFDNSSMFELGCQKGAKWAKERCDAYWLQQILIQVENALNAAAQYNELLFTGVYGVEDREKFLNQIKKNYEQK